MQFQVAGNITIPATQEVFFAGSPTFTGNTLIPPDLPGFNLIANSSTTQMLNSPADNSSISMIADGVALTTGTSIGVNIMADNTQLNNLGTIQTTTASGIRITSMAAGTSTITNAGMIRVTGNAGNMSGAIHNSTTNTVAITNSGTITVAGATHGIYSDATSGTLRITNSGTIVVNTGNLIQTGASNDTLILQTGTTFTLNGGGNTGRINLGGGTNAVQVAGNITIPATQEVFFAGSPTFTGDTLIPPDLPGFNLIANSSTTQMLNSPADNSSISMIADGVALTTSTSVGVNIMANNASVE